MKKWLGLAAIMSVFYLGDGAAASERGKSEKSQEQTKFHEIDGLHLLNPSPTEFRRFLQQRFPNETKKECNSWSNYDSRVGLLIAIEGASLLLIGESYGPKVGGNEENISGIEQQYFVENFAKGGAPLEGQISIKLRPNLVREERACLEKLRDISIRWATVEKGAINTENTVEMVVQGVQFSRVGRLEPSGVMSPTGETLATLTLSESWMSMVCRKMKEQIWGAALGFAGSVCLMAFGLVIRRLLWYTNKMRKDTGVKQD